MTNIVLIFRFNIRVNLPIIKLKNTNTRNTQARSQTKVSGGAKQIFEGALYINVLNINAIFNLFTLTSH